MLPRRRSRQSPGKADGVVAVGVVAASGEGLDFVEAGGSSLLQSAHFVCAGY